MAWKTVAGIVVGLAVCNLAVAFREVGRHKDKIWLHRCNSMEKLCEKEHMYPNGRWIWCSGKTTRSTSPTTWA